jgi:2-dehydro-3-deoxyphosphooctonate aldolase (KDO 8-P synthase)
MCTQHNSPLNERFLSTMTSSSQHHITLGDFSIGNDLPFVLIAGPCAMESKDHTFELAGKLKEITTRLGIPLIYKSSFDKANRTSLKAGRGIGIEKGLPVFDEVRKKMNLPVITDIHAPEQCAEVGAVVDVLQIPAFLCRQTDLLIAAAKTGKAINIKKGQFLAPWDMKNVAAKITESGNPNVMLCERGVTFGYNTLVNDMRALPIMAETGHPVVFDATHSVQQPGGAGTATSGDRRMVPPLARAALAIGCAAVFMETHEDPDRAPSDGPNMVKLHDLEGILEQMLAIDRLMKAEAYKEAQKAA